MSSHIWIPADLTRTRREAIGGGLALIGGLAMGSTALALPPTETMTIGPFYPVIRPLDHDGDLTRVNGMKVAAKGDIMHLSGRVLDTNGKPIAGAKVELWQANAAGRYAHPADISAMPLDDGFQGFGIQISDAEGRYRFKTVKPAAYAIPGGQVRTPHIHFDVQGKGSRIVTQMFFPGEPLNATDFLLKAESDKTTFMASVLPPLADDPAALAYNWDIVLLSG